MSPHGVPGLRGVPGALPGLPGAQGRPEPLPGLDAPRKALRELLGGRQRIQLPKALELNTIPNTILS